MHQAGRKQRPDIYEEILRARREGQRVALATVVSQSGSTPRKDTAKMLVFADGTIIGTVGGGGVEADVCRKGQEAITTGLSSLLKYELTNEDAEKEGFICGGIVEVFVEPVLPDPRLVIFGAGHLGVAIADLALTVGFDVSVIDDRESFANPARFSPKVDVVCRAFDAPLDELRINSESFLLMVTRGHRWDQIALGLAVHTGARYVGMVGSRRKIVMTVQSLLDKGWTPDLFKNLYAPIGIEIGSETPEEIAVAVVAEMIAIRKGVHKRSEKQQFVMEQIAKAKSADD